MRCTETAPQTDGSSTPRGGLPLLALSNEDPAPASRACTSGGSVPATSANLYVAIDYAVTATDGWERTVPAWPQPMQDVTEGELPTESMPCGPGGYARFQAGGTPFIAWAGFGSEVTEADREALLGAFDAMQVRDAGFTVPSSPLPGYVLTGGEIDGVPWALEAMPGNDGPQMAIVQPGTAVFDDSPATFTLGDEPIQPVATLVGETRISWGAVAPEAERVEFRPAGGGEAIVATPLALPAPLASSFDAFVVLHDARSPGRLVAVGGNGELGGLDTVDIAVPTASPAAFPPTSVPDDAVAVGQDFGGTWVLHAYRDEDGRFCTRMDFASTGTVATGPGDCSTQRPPSDRPTVERVGFAEGQFALVWVPRDVVGVTVIVGNETVAGETGLASAPGFGDVLLAVLPLPDHGSGAVTFETRNGPSSYDPEPIEW